MTSVPVLIGGNPVDAAHPIPVQDPSLSSAALRDAIVAAISSTLHAIITGTVDASGSTVHVDNFPSSQPVTGPLTDAQLRASSVPVSGPLTDAQLRASAVPISESHLANLDIAISALRDALRGAAGKTLSDIYAELSGTLAVSGPLTDTQLRASAVPISESHLANLDIALSALRDAIKGGKTLADIVTALGTTLAVSAAALPLPTGAATEATQVKRYGGGKTPYSAVLSTAGDTTIVTPPAGHKIRLSWAGFVPNSDNSSANLVTVQFGLTSGSPTKLYTCYALAHWEQFDGPTDAPLVVNLANANPVAVNLHYEVI